MNARPKTAQRREQIMLASLDIFLEQGVENTRIEDICRRAGASVGSIYHHFSGKRALADALYLEALERYLKPLDQTVSKVQTPPEFFKAIVSHHINWVRDNRAWARYLLLIRRHDRSAEQEEKIAQLNGQYLKGAFDLLKKYAACGQIRILPRYLYAPMIMGPCQELVRQYLENRRGSLPDDVIDTVADVIWRGLKS